MEEAENSHNINNVQNLHTNLSKQEQLAHKILMEEINKNTKELESFLNMNTRLRGNLTELIQAYLNNNDERLKACYGGIKEALKMIEANTFSVNIIILFIYYSKYFN